MILEDTLNNYGEERVIDKINTLICILCLYVKRKFKKLRFKLKELVRLKINQRSNTKKVNWMDMKP